MVGVSKNVSELNTFFTVYVLNSIATVLMIDQDCQEIAVQPAENSLVQVCHVYIRGHLHSGHNDGTERINPCDPRFLAQNSVYVNQ